MHRIMVFLFFFFNLFAQKYANLSAFAEQQSTFQLQILSLTQTLENGIQFSSDTSTMNYQFSRIDSKSEQHSYAISLIQDKLKKSNKSIPAFSDVIITLDSRGSLMNVSGIQNVEREIQVMLSEMMETRGLTYNNHAQFLKHIISDPKLLRRVILNQPMTFFNFFRDDLAGDIDSPKQVKLTNPIGSTPLDALQTKTLYERDRFRILEVTQTVKNHDMTDAMKQLNSTATFNEIYLLNYAVKSKYYLDARTQVPDKLIISKNVNINQQERLTTLVIEMRN